MIARRASLVLALAARELRGGLGGFRIFLACLALGVGAIAAVGSLSEAMLAGLGAESRVLLGGDLSLRLTHREITAEQRAWLAARGEVSELAEMRAMAHAPVADGPRNLIELRAVDDAYPLYGAVAVAPAQDLHDSLARRDGAWGAAAAPALLARLDLGLGDRVRVGELIYELRVELTGEPDHLGRNFSLGPTLMVARESLAETGLVQPGSLVSYRYRLRLPEETDIAALRRDLAAAFPEAGWRVRGPRGAAPGVRHFLNRLTLFLTFVGLTSLLVGGLGVGNGVRSYLQGKLATIATFKCLGAPSSLILQVYLAQVGALAAAGIVLGLVLGAGTSHAVVWALGDRFGWQGAGGIYPGPLALAALFGTLVTVAFSLAPLVRAGRVSPAALFRAPVAPLTDGLSPGAWAAIGLAVAALAALTVLSAEDRWVAAIFVAGAAGAFALFRGAAWALVALVRRLPRPRRTGLRLALANLHRPGAPTGSVVLSLGLGLTVLVAIAQIEANLAGEVRRGLPADAPAFYFLDIQPDQAADFAETARAVPGATEPRMVPMLRGRITAVNGTPPKELDIPHEIAWVFRGDRGLTWSREAPEGADLVAGEWWPADYDGPPLVSLDAEVGEALSIGPGDRLGINLLGRNFEVEIANLRAIDWTTLGINFVLVFSPGLMERAPQTWIATVGVPPEAEEALERAVTNRFANVSAVRVREALAALARIIGHIATAVSITAVAGLAAGLLVLAGAVAAGHRRRVYDAVVLKVLGATRATLARAFLYEYGLLGLVTATLAAGAGTVAGYFVMTEVMDMAFTFAPAAVAGTALLGAAVVLLLGFAGTWRALSHKAAPLLRNE
jgi:putative ABC transport system permease protein